MAFEINYFQTKNDSLKLFIQKAKNKKLSNSKRKEILLDAYEYFNNNEIQDPIHLSSIAFEFYRLRDTINFFKTNQKALELSKKHKNIFSIGDSHWNYATFYLNGEIHDKAYYHFNEAYKNFIKNGNKKEASKILNGMARIKGYYRDYTGSEILSIEAIKLFKELENYESLSSSYNHLGLLQRDIKEYDKALRYFSKALEYFKKVKIKPYGIENNIANIYVKKKEYSKALKYYSIDLNQDISRSHYARVLSNRANCKLLMRDTLGVKKDLFESLRIRDSLGNKINILTSKIYISNYYTYKKDTLKAIIYSQEANLLAKKLKNGADYLTTLKQLADLQPKKAKKYLDRYIQFNDSLISEERRAQNKFTRIEFETDEHIEQNKILSQQRIWIFAGSLAVLLISTLLYFLRVQKVQNEKLQLEAEQQKANEEVYVLTLQQQAKLEEERVNERNRISAELHDGILGKLFGTRVSLGFLGMQMQPDTQEQHQTFLDELQNIEKEIRDVSHRLSENFDDATVSFSTIIEQVLKDKSVIGNFKYTFVDDTNISWKSLDEVTKANVYRIIQESLQNIIKHAKAKSVTLNFGLNNQKLFITITDDGVGFDTKKGKKGIGIKNIKTRVEKLSGSVDFLSEIDQGTTLTIIIPYIPKNAA
ncbi:tetratricopeptide repeat-containing sensor histidine kinase [Tenacibaculum sp. MEBiC06402]|uniref:tetratricopeptide repeat-containing sensor histidine kinase n=1 Tax=unclassified Tenacibaculum TaxID=2635139 RepID=UPI003B9BE9BB